MLSVTGIPNTKKHKRKRKFKTNLHPASPEDNSLSCSLYVIVFHVLIVKALKNFAANIFYLLGRETNMILIEMYNTGQQPARV